METTIEPQATIEPVTISDVLNLATWDRPRTDQEIHALIERRSKALGSFSLDDILVS